ncbi:MAG TPA: cysteine desulfurase family protein [Allosphingosinicella sp.]|jgi:cysteine desulfurase
MAHLVRQTPRRVKPVTYLDYQATTPLAAQAAAAMRPWLDHHFANPHSPHRTGREAAAAIEVARERVETALLFQSAHVERSRDTLSSEAEKVRANGLGRVYFTSGATEAANWALKGAAVRLPPNKRRIVTLATEHACVLDTVAWLASQGFETDILPVQPDGLIDLSLAAERITPETGLVAAMLVNNEIGVIQPVAQLAALAHAAGALFFCDAVQGFGRVPIALDACDMVAVSAHKVHGPKGIGALWLRDGVAIDPLLHGGGQECGLRSGTLSPALCVGFGEAARLLVERREEDAAHVERLWSVARNLMKDWTLNGSPGQRYHGNLNLRRDGVDAARLISELRTVAFSAGSACASGSGRPSHVLSALGLSGREARSSIRIGFGRHTSEKELAEALTRIDEAAARQLSPAA